MKDRRHLRFGRMEDILRDVECLDAHAANGGLRAIGNWTPGQVVDHVTKMINFSIDGFPEPRGPLLLRLIGTMLRDHALIRPMRPGFRFPRKFKFLAPEPDITWARAVANLQKTIGRIDSGQRMTVPSPVLGPLVHEQWIQLHYRHAEMHLSFIHPSAGPAAD